MTTREESSHDYLEHGLLITLNLPATKEPIGVNWTADSKGSRWGEQIWTHSEVDRAYATIGDCNPGLVVGPRSGFIIFDPDDAAAEDVFTSLWQGEAIPLGPRWQTRRGLSRLFKWHPDLELFNAAVINIGKLQILAGAGGYNWQGLLPPSITDDIERYFIEGFSAPVPELTTAVVQEIFSRKGKLDNWFHKKPVKQPKKCKPATSQTRKRESVQTKPPLHEAFNRKSDNVQTDDCVVGNSSTDNPDNPDTILGLSALSALSVEQRTREQLWQAITLTVPTVEGIRNSRLIELGNWCLRVAEVREWFAEDFEPVIRLWFDLMVKNLGPREDLGPREWSETWGEWLYIWSWLDRDGQYQKVDTAYDIAMKRPFPPMPDSYRSKAQRELVALFAAMQEIAADENGVWFIGARDAATRVGLLAERNGKWEPLHETAAAFIRVMVTDGIVQRICHHCSGVNTIQTTTVEGKKKRACTACNRSLTGSLKAQRYRYVGYSPCESAASAA